MEKSSTPCWPRGTTSTFWASFSEISGWPSAETALRNFEGNSLPATKLQGMRTRGSKGAAFAAWAFLFFLAPLSEARLLSFQVPAAQGFGADVDILPVSSSRLGSANLLPPWFHQPRESHIRGILLIAEALGWQGTAYRFGGESREGVDCSGFLRAVLTASFPDRAHFPRTSEGFASIGKKTEAIEPGDILLFAEEDRIFHVGLALGGDSFIHSASEGPQRGVIISSLSEYYWAKRYIGARRIEY